MANPTIKITVEMVDKVSKQIDDIKRSMDGLSTKTKMTSSSFSALSGSVGSASRSILNGIETATKYGTVIAGVGAGVAVTAYNIGEKFVNAAADQQKALLVLGMVSERYGESQERAQKQAQALSSELRIGLSSTAESLQYLLKSGLNLDQSTELLRRFTNEAITGKSEYLSLSDAVQNLAFSFSSQNSTLGNASGIAENYYGSGGIIDRGLKILQAQGKYLNETEQSLNGVALAEAKYAGLLEITNITLGSSQKLAGTYIDKQAELEQKKKQLSVTIGQKLMPIYSKFIDLQIRLIPYIEKVANVVEKKLTKFWAENGKEIKQLAENTLVNLYTMMVKLAPVIEAFAIKLFQVGAFIVEHQTYFMWFVGILTSIATAVAIATISINWWIVAIVALSAVLALIADNWTTIKQKAMDAINWIIGIIPTVIGVILPFIGVLMLIAQNWDTIKNKAMNAINWIIGGLGSLMNKSIEIAQGIGNVFSGMWSAFTSGADIAINSFTGKFGQAKDFFWQKIRDMQILLEELWQKANEVIDRIKKKIKELPSNILGGLGGIGKSIIPGINTGGVIEGDGRVHRFANGGVVPGTGNSDTVPAMLTPGEVVYNPRRPNTRNKFLEATGLGGKNITINVNGVTNPETVARMVMNMLNREMANI